MKVFQARKEQEFLQTVEEINSTHKSKVDSYLREHHELVSKMSAESADKVDRLQRKSQDKLNKVT